MKKIFAAALAMSLAHSAVFAADAEYKNTETIDNSTNPITGTKKTVKKTHVTKKNLDGTKAEMAVKKTTKTTKKGKVTKEVEVDADGTIPAPTR